MVRETSCLAVLALWCLHYGARVCRLANLCNSGAESRPCSSICINLELEGLKRGIPH
jgi:hypothetical protein